MGISSREVQYYELKDRSCELLRSAGLVFSMFDGAWPILAGEMVRAELLYVREDSDARYAIPAKVNGLSMYLLAERGTDGVGRVLGETQGYDENGFAIRGSIPLEAGMRVVPLYTAVGADGELSEYEGAEIRVPEGGLALRWQALPKGDYEYCFGLTNLSGGVQYTKTVVLRI